MKLNLQLFTETEKIKPRKLITWVLRPDTKSQKQLYILNCTRLLKRYFAYQFYYSFDWRRLLLRKIHVM
jgi:hypothetical protein